MAANTEKEVVGKFHPRCGPGTEFSNERRVATGKGDRAFAFSNDQFPIGVQFCVKILQKGTDYVSLISASSRPVTQISVPQKTVLPRTVPARSVCYDQSPLAK